MSRRWRGFRKKAQELQPSNEDDHNEHDHFTAEVENDCDILNDKTFEGRLDVGGVDAHNNVIQLEDQAKHTVICSSLADSLSDEDSLNFKDVVQRSIYHIGLDDDSDEDPAITTYSKANTSLGPAKWGRLRSSPPPPVIIYQRSDGSPMMETIWTPKPVDPSAPNDQLPSLLWKLQPQQQHQESQEDGLVEHQAPASSSFPLNARTLEDVERVMLSSASTNPVPTKSPRPDSPSASGETHAKRSEGDDFVKHSLPPASATCSTMNEGPTTPAKPGSVDHLPHVLPGQPFSNEPRIPQFRFSPGSSAYPPGIQAGPVLPAPVGRTPPHGRMPKPTHGRMSQGNHPNGFGNRIPLPPRPDFMLGHAMRGQLPLPSNLSGFKPRTPQINSQHQSTRSQLDNQQLPHYSAYGNQGGATFGGPPTGFGNSMSLPPAPYSMPGPGGVMVPPGSSMLVNNAVMRGQTPLPSNLTGFQPGTNQVHFESQYTGRRPRNQQPTYQTVFSSLGGAAYGTPTDGFGNRMALPTSHNPMLNPGCAVIPPLSLNAPAIRRPILVPSNLPGFQPGINQLHFEPQNSGGSHHYQQHAYQTVFGNYGGTTFGRPHQDGGGVQQQIWHPYPRTPFPGNLDHRGGRNGLFRLGGSVVAVSNGPGVVTPVS